MKKTRRMSPDTGPSEPQFFMLDIVQLSGKYDRHNWNHDFQPLRIEGDGVYLDSAGLGLLTEAEKKEFVKPGVDYSQPIMKLPCTLGELNQFTDEQLNVHIDWFDMAEWILGWKSQHANYKISPSTVEGDKPLAPQAKNSYLHIITGLIFFLNDLQKDNRFPIPWQKGLEKNLKNQHVITATDRHEIGGKLSGVTVSRIMGECAEFAEKRGK